MRKLKRRLSSLKTTLIPYNKKTGNIENIKKYEDEAEKISQKMFYIRTKR